MISTTRSTRIALPVLASLALALTLVGCSDKGVATVEIGESTTVPMSDDGKTNYTMSVDDLTLLTPDEVEKWGVSKPFGTPADVAGKDVYFVRYTAEGADGAEVKTSSFVPSNWALTNADEEEFVGDLVGTTDDEADCQGLDEGETTGCQVIAVPEGEKIVMVRFIGANNGYTKGTAIGSSDWVGWTVS